MSDATVKPISIDALNNGNNLFQSPFWAEARREQNYRVLPFLYSGPLGEVKTVAVLRPALSGDRYAYFPWAPDVAIEEESQGKLLESIASALGPFLPDDCLFVRFDLPWMLPYDVEEDQEYPGNDGRPPTRIRELRMNFNTSDWNLFKAPTNMQPVDTVVLDITKEESRLLQEMKSKTRYNIRLSQKRGVEVEEAGSEKLQLWYEMFSRTMKRKGVKAGSFDYFKSLFAVKEEAGQTCRFPSVELKLLLAKKAGEYLAGIVIALCDDYALYLYGASTERRRNLMPTYRLQWEAIEYAKEYGCTRYDLHGIPKNKSRNNPMYGLLQFKKGFGGYTVHRRGCWDYPYNKERYERLKMREAADAGFYAVV